MNKISYLFFWGMILSISIATSHAQNLMKRTHIGSIVDLDHDQEWLVLSIPSLKVFKQKKWEQSLIKKELDEFERDGWSLALSFSEITKYKKHFIQPKETHQNLYFLSTQNTQIYGFHDEMEKEMKDLKPDDRIVAFFSRKWSTSNIKQLVEKDSMKCQELIDQAKFNDAIALGQKNLIRNPQHGPTILCIIQAYLKNDQNSDHEYYLSFDYLQGLKFDGSHDELIELDYWQAIAYEKIQEFDEALKQYQKIRPLNHPKINPLFIQKRIQLLSQKTFTKLYFSTPLEQQDQKLYSFNLNSTSCANPSEDTSTWTNCTLKTVTNAYDRPMSQEEIEENASIPYKNVYLQDQLKCATQTDSKWQKVLVNEGCIYYIEHVFMNNQSTTVQQDTPSASKTKKKFKIQFKHIFYTLLISCILVLFRSFIIDWKRKIKRKNQ